MKILLALSLTLALGSSARAARHAPPAEDSCIDQERLSKTLKNIRKDTKWQLEGPMLWGFFFLDDDLPRLTKTLDELERDGYRFVELIARKSTRGKFLLHVQRVEALSADALRKRNQAFCELADSMGIRSYEGMEVGPAPAGDGRPKQGRRHLTRR